MSETVGCYKPLYFLRQKFSFCRRGPLLTGPQYIHIGVEKLEKYQNPVPQEPLENVFLIDWLTVTLFDVTVDKVKSMLGLDGADVPWMERQVFCDGYPMTTSWNNISIRWGADDPKYYSDDEKKTAEEKARTDMGISLNLSGQGCRAFETYGAGDWMKLFETNFDGSIRANPTRIDLAYDDHIGYLDIAKMREDLEDRAIVCKARYTKTITSDDWDENVKGTTLYIGSEKSRVLIRIYDKAAERGFNHTTHWIRVETTLRKERAAVAVMELLKHKHVGKVAAGILRNYCTFRTPSADTNKSRWPIAPYWEKVLNDMDRITLWITPGEPYNFSKTERYLVEQYGQALLTHLAMHGTVYELICQARKRFPELKPKYQITLQDHKLLMQEQQKRIREAAKSAGWANLPDFEIIPEDMLEQTVIDEIFGIKD